MLCLYYIVFFFIILFNYVFPNIIEKRRLENILFKKAENNSYTKITCKYNTWFVLSKNIRNIDIEFITRNGEILDCEKYNPQKNDVYVSCGKKGLFNNKSHVCYIILSELLFIL